jgi:hypothetical protein
MIGSINLKTAQRLQRAIKALSQARSVGVGDGLKFNKGMLD